MENQPLNPFRPKYDLPNIFAILFPTFSTGSQKGAVSDDPTGPVLSLWLATSQALQFFKLVLVPVKSLSAARREAVEL